jgi:hypothetical protein
VNWAIPLSLTASQSWTITGDNGATPYGGSLALLSPVTGSGATLNAQLGSEGSLAVRNGMQVSTFAATGANTADSGFKAASNGTIFPTSLNSSPAAPVSVSDVVLNDEHLQTSQPVPDDIGPLTASGAFINVGDGNSPDAILAVQGAVNLDASTVTQFSIDQAGSTPSTDYSQLTATGNVSLAGTLSVAGNCSMGTGSTATLITTTGTLSGTFANAPEGGIVAFENSCSPSLAAQIHYTSNSVTATVVAGGTTATTLSASPTTATTNQPVSMTATVTTGTPLYAGPAGTVQFLNGTTAIPGCTAQPLTASNATTGTATCAVAFAAAGSPAAVSAVYTPAGGSGLAGSTSPPLSLTVSPAATTMTVAASSATITAGQSVTYTAKVTPARAGAIVPTGAVRFLDGSTTVSGCQSQPVSSAGLATCTSAPGAGAHSITAAYAGDANFSTSTSPATMVTVTTSSPASGAPRIGAAKLSGTTAAVPVSCTGRGSCTVVLTLSVTETLKGGKLVAVAARRTKTTKHVVILARVRVTIAAGHSKTVTLRLSSAGRRLLARRGRLAVKLDTSQLTASRSRLIASRTLTFKTRKAHRGHTQ